MNCESTAIIKETTVKREKQTEMTIITEITILKVNVKIVEKRGKNMAVNTMGDKTGNT